MNLLDPEYDLDDFVIYQASKLITSDFPYLIIQAPSLVQSSGYECCPVETIQITHTGAHHWILFSSLGREITIYDSLGMQPTDTIKQQMKQLFSADNSLPAYKLGICQKQVGSHDCGVFAIANAVELLINNQIENVIFDQTKKRQHLVQCFETGKITPFPKYSTSSKKEISKVHTTLDSDWKTLRRSQRIKEKDEKGIQKLKLSNRYEKLTSLEPPLQNESKKAAAINKSMKKELNQSDVIENLSNYMINESEKSVLEKGLNFCPTTESPNKLRLLDDLYFFCRKLRLKEFFYNPAQEVIPDEEDDSLLTDDERCPLKKNVSNPYYNPPKDPSFNLNTYLSKVRECISRLIQTPNRYKSNLTSKEHAALTSLAKNEEIVIKSADKGGKIVVMDKKEYKMACENNLSDRKFYEELAEDPNVHYAKEVRQEATKMKDDKSISAKEFDFITSQLDDPKTPIFYGLPKIHKIFSKFPPLRPIVSHVNSCTRRLSEFLDSFLKRQAQLCSSFVRDTKHFLQKIEEIKSTKLPDNTILVTMDGTSLYTNIDHHEGADACFDKLEKRTKNHFTGFENKYL